jgi:tetratricopeptide (TPR) repeat protein
MRKHILSIVAVTALITTSFNHVQAQTPPARGPRLMIVAFDNRSGQSTQNYLSLALAMTLAEKLESAGTFRLLNGPLVLTAEQARLFPGGTDDLVAAADLARSKGADFLVTGRYSGKTWDWSLTVEVYALDGQLPTIVGTGEAKGSQMTPFKKASGQTTLIVGMKNIIDMLAMATEQAFDEAGLPLSDAALAELARLPTNDAYAYQLLARAFDRHFATGRLKTDKTALEIAEHAVLVDPMQAGAQRFYAYLLDQNGLPKKARIHYEAALAKTPDDGRSLIALGRIEIGQSNFEAARTLLIRATRVRNDDAESHYWLAQAFLKLNEPARAIIEFEEARNIDGGLTDARRQLTKLYAGFRRYADAAVELRAIIAAAPDDLESAFLLAACLRADGKIKEAAEAYADARTRFPKESRLPKFQGDMLAKLGDASGAKTAYEAANGLDPADPRSADAAGVPVKSPTKGKTAAPYGLDAFTLVDRVRSGNRLRTEMSEARLMFRDAANDAALELTLRGKLACGAAASSTALADEAGKRYQTIGIDLQTAAVLFSQAIERGETAALTPDENEELGRLLADQKDSVTDLAEMRSQYDRTLLPLLKQYGCKTGVPTADIGRVRSRNNERLVALPEVKPPQYSMPITPQIAPNRARSVVFTIDNTAGKRDYLLYVDDIVLGKVPAGRTQNFISSVGRHLFCLLPPELICGQPGTLRQVFLHDGWTMVVKPAE